MLIKFLHPIASAEGWAHPPGKAVEIEDTQARAFIGGGIAVGVEPEPASVPQNRKANKAR